MKNTRKTVTIPEQNVAKERIVFRLCGETPLKMLVNRDLARSAEPKVEILPHALHSRLRHLCDHQSHHQKHHQHHRQRYATKLHQHPSTQRQHPLQMSHHRSRHLQLHLQHRLLGQLGHQAMIQLFLRGQLENQPIHLHGVCKRGVAPLAPSP